MNQEQEQPGVSYVCEGECAAKLTQEEWEKHESKVCGAETCSHKGKPFVRKEEAQ